MTEQQYIDYFAALARQHTAIKHTDQQPRFYCLHDDNRAELENAVRTKLRLPCVAIDQYYDTLMRQHDNYRLRILGGISVLVSCVASDPADIRRARAEARTLVLQFVNRMVADCRNPQSVLFQQRVVPTLDFEGQPVPILAGTATGWAYPIEWLVPTTVAVDPSCWQNA